MNEEYEFEIPKELTPWMDYQRKLEAESRSVDKFYYIMVNGKIKHANMFEWSKWFFNIENRRIDYTELETGHVSTVFLGIDHDFSIDKLLQKKPILFETMVFGSELNEFQWRYSTLGEAKQGHYEIVNAIREKRKPEMKWGQEGFWNSFKKMFEEENE